MGAAWGGSPVSAAKLAETLAFRGYDAHDYEIALQAAREVGWLEETSEPGNYNITSKGIELREKVEQQTNEYFFVPWAVLTPGELDELYTLLSRLRERLRGFRKSK